MAKADLDSNPELDDFAFRLYAERISKMPTQSNGTEVSRWAYAKAKDFFAVRERARAGEVNTIARQSRLADCSTPNCRPTHPFNLISQRFAEQNGGEEKVLRLVKRIVDWLIAHPHSDQNPVALEQLDRHDPSTRLDWNVPTTNLARAILPEYCTN